jgi:hypothetical protein
MVFRKLGKYSMNFETKISTFEKLLNFYSKFEENFVKNNLTKNYRNFSNNEFDFENSE